MLVLLFEVGADRYAIDVGRVVEVLPLVEFRRVPHAPPEVAGVFDFRGIPVPAVDLAMLTLGRPADRRLSTRVIVVRGADHTGQILALITERTTATERRMPHEFQSSGVLNPRAPYLGPVAGDARGLLQLIDVTRILPAAVHDELVRPRVEATWPSPISSAL
jgi:chemotaxis-related protein WspB